MDLAFDMTDFNVANGKLIVEQLEDENVMIFRVIKVAKNMNYEGVPRKIEPGDIVVLRDRLYLPIKLNGKRYYIVHANIIDGYIKGE